MVLWFLQDSMLENFLYFYLRIVALKVSVEFLWIG